MKKTTLLLLTLILLAAKTTFAASPTPSEIKATENKIANTLGTYPTLFEEYKSQEDRKVKLDKVKIDYAKGVINLYFSFRLYELPIREALIEEWESALFSQIKSYIPKQYSSFELQLWAVDTPLENYIPNLYRSTTKVDESRKGKIQEETPLTFNPSKGLYSKGLSHRSIALWPSHGYVYETRDEKPSWQFQRPALFRTIEDLNTFQYCYNYIIPMLENAGAVVVSPRERSPQTIEVIIDNDMTDKSLSPTILSGEWSKSNAGYRHIETLTDENPHSLGTYLSSSGTSEIEFKTTLPSSGRYGVTISYKSLTGSSKKVEAVISHSQGESTVEINQQMGGSSWVYLGEWDFSTTATLTLRGTDSGIITADAVRFGGGMGSVERGGKVSGKARWAEAARYYMQYSGVDPSVYTVGEIESKKDPRRKKSTPDKLDYIDDYKGRGNWVNYLRQEKNIPIDLSLGVHTDAGIADSIYGTLTIHYSNKRKGKLWDKSSKLASRDLADIIQSEVCRHIETNITSDWTRRALFDREYAEVSRPEVPSLILEMFSHQNSIDMQFGTSPRFRFQMSRAIYVGILKFLSDRYNTDYVVQPLPLKSFDMELCAGDSIRLKWEDNIDNLEPTATPTHYVLYTRLGEGTGFDNGRVIYGTHIDLPIERDGIVRSYRVTACNDGGESFPSETLSCGFSQEASAIPVIQVKNNCKRFSTNTAYLWDYSYCGEITDKDKHSEFVDNENPGYGGSSKEFAGFGRSAETLDNTMAKGTEILRNKGNYISRGSGRNHWIL